jgi:polar amino acid transport system substrate-binding protein
MTILSRGPLAASFAARASRELATFVSTFAALVSAFVGFVFLFALFVPALIAPSSAFAAEAADPLSVIKARGKLIVGVKKDVLLWGYQDPKTGELTGMEVDLARSLARDLGVELKLVGLRSVERIDAIETGRVDVLIATLSDSPERRQQVKMILPHYYSSGVNLLARKSEKFRAWNELKNRKICGRRGSFYNRPITVKYSADIVAFHSLEWALQAVRDGRCSALVYDDTAIVALLQRPEWAQDFEMPMPSLYTVPWAVAIDYRNSGTTFEQAISAAIIGWHRTGSLARIEKGWNIPASDFVRDMHAAWDKKLSNGSWHCGSEVSETTPPECL